jgi:folate-binding Fe-S cluster repair protein YgfZ
MEKEAFLVLQNSNLSSFWSYIQFYALESGKQPQLDSELHLLQLQGVNTRTALVAVVLMILQTE